MDIQGIIKTVRSGVCKIEFYKDNNLVNSGSGFIYKNKLITNSHVFHPEGSIFPENTKLILIFGDNRKIETTIKNLELEVGSDEANADYAVYKIPNKDNDKFNFELSNLDSVNEGDEVLLFGFPFDANYLTTHHGRISSIFENNGIKKIQIDASVNQGNSGGPLYHMSTNKVIGIVTRKESGLTKDFDALLSSFSSNIEVLKNAQKSGGIIQMFGINPIKFFEESQSQMKLISKNIKRSANTGIGYAFSCGKLLKENI